MKLLHVLAALMPLSATALAAPPGDPTPATGPLVTAYIKARGADPLFRAAVADRDANLIAARVAGVAYYPQLSINTDQFQYDVGVTRRTISLTQPLVSVDRYATMKEEEPRRRIAETTFQLNGADLARRLYQAAANLIRSREGHQLNLVRIKTVEQQYNSAKRAFELKQGTVTDLRDAEVRSLQAAAEDHRLRASVTAAERDYASIVGDNPPAFRLADPRKNNTRLVAGSLEAVDSNSPALIVAREQKRIAELGIVKARSAWLPTLSATVIHTAAADRTDNIVGLTLAMPIQAGSVLNSYSADAQMAKLSETARDTERKIKLDTQRLNDMIQAGIAEVEGRRIAIDAAELSVQANEKSFKGGVRSMADLMNAIENLYRLKTEHVQAILTLGENLLNLRLLEGNDALVALREVESVVLLR